MLRSGSPVLITCKYKKAEKENEVLEYGKYLLEEYSGSNILTFVAHVLRRRKGKEGQEAEAGELVKHLLGLVKW